jgi:hypothetical protein
LVWLDPGVDSWVVERCTFGRSGLDYYFSSRECYLHGDPARSVEVVQVEGRFLALKPVCYTPSLGKAMNLLGVAL